VSAGYRGGDHPADGDQGDGSGEVNAGSSEARPFAISKSVGAWTSRAELN
jgi:hypothetical protein